MLASYLPPDQGLTRHLAGDTHVYGQRHVLPGHLPRARDRGPLEVNAKHAPSVLNTRAKPRMIKESNVSDQYPQQESPWQPHEPQPQQPLDTSAPFENGPLPEQQLMTMPLETSKAPPKTTARKRTIITIAALAVLLAAGGATYGLTRHHGPTAAQIAAHKAYEVRKAAAAAALAQKQATQAAISTAVKTECQTGRTIAGEVNAATTVGEFDAGWQEWTSELTAANSIPMTGVPDGSNDARLIAVDFAKANLAIFEGSRYSNVFSGFNKNKLSNDYGLAQSALQDVLNQCTSNGD